MLERFKELEKVVPLQGILGYLNFAGGKPDVRFQSQLNEAYVFLAEHDAEHPWSVLHAILAEKLAVLKKTGVSGFQNVEQAERVLGLVFDKVLPAYRQHHKDLLQHLSDRDLVQPLFLARLFEAVLSQGGPWNQHDRILRDSIKHLNDFVGYRPVATLENRPRGEVYEHERVRPIPLFIRGAGVGWGPYRELIQQALEILESTDHTILQEAYFDPEALIELAVDPRAYDHGHPVNRRPNYVFGEWDPHLIDNQGRYRRYVARSVTLDALVDRISHTADLDKEELVFEAGAVLAGTMLMASGTSGSGPNTHDSTTNLAALMPRIAAYRDAFYSNLIARVEGKHGERLRLEASQLKQPFAKARQHLNRYLAQHRAAQLQHRHLALLFARMGYAPASHDEAARIPAASIRISSEILCLLTSANLLTDKGKLSEAIGLLPKIESLVEGGIQCGALPDPWNILGFQGLFPLFFAREDSVQDNRIDELLRLVAETLVLYSRLSSECAALGKIGQGQSLLEHLRRFAAWWDQYASFEVSEVRRVHGAESVSSAEHVAQALSRWHEPGETTADIAFWKNHLEGFQSAKAFSLVIGALLDRGDLRASMALLMNWIGQADQIALQDGEHSFHTLALDWMMLTTSPPSDTSGQQTQPPAAADSWSLVVKFFDYLEANADEFWQVPALDEEPEQLSMMPRQEESLYSAAYEDVTYHDSADDNQEGPVADDAELGAPFPLEYQSERLNRRLQFHMTLARLWHLAAAYGVLSATLAQRREREAVLEAWLTTARRNEQALLNLLDSIQEQPIPAPLGSYDSLVEYDRHRLIKQQLLYAAIDTCLHSFLAVGSLEGALGKDEESEAQPPESKRPRWEGLAIQLEQAALAGDSARARQILPPFLNLFQDEQLLFTPLEADGHPRLMLRARIAQSIMRALVETLPGLGLVRETWHVLDTARMMEKAHPLQGKGVTEFTHLFQAGFQEVLQTILGSSAARVDTPKQNQRMIDLLEQLTRRFLALWVDHSQNLQLSILETIRDDSEWNALLEFVERYGHDLFHAKFMTLANLRAILHRGVESHLDYLRDHGADQPIRLLEDLDKTISRQDALRRLGVVLQALVENYEQYKDYNTTTAQSDYGENLYLLLDFLRLKCAYERHVWRLRPLAMCHEVLAQAKRADLAASWYEGFERLTHELADHYEAQLRELEQKRGIVLRTVADRIHERFVEPLAVDRICALIEPAVEEVRQESKRRSFLDLQRELKTLTSSPTGAGLDVPEWLRRMEAEVARAEAGGTELALLAQERIHLPGADLALEDIQAQLDAWDKLV